MEGGVKEFILNTPEKHWIVVYGYHLHKSFFGIIFVLVSIILFLLYRKKYSSKRLIFYLSLASLFVGLILLFLSITGNIYTGNFPYFKLIN